MNQPVRDRNGDKIHGSQVQPKGDVQNIHGEWTILPKMYLFSHEFSDLGYLRHFTRCCIGSNSVDAEELYTHETAIFPCLSSNAVGGPYIVELILRVDP